MADNKLNLMRVLFSFFTCLSCTVAAMAEPVDLESDFLKLDSVVAARYVYIKNKQTAIANYKNNFGHFETDIELYGYNKHMFDEYVKFDADSAFLYASRCLEIAERANLANEKVMSEIDMIFIMILQGNFLKAKMLLDELGPIEGVPAMVRPKLAIAYLEFHVRVNTLIQNTYGTYDKNIKKLITDTWERHVSYLSESWMSHYYEVMITNRGSRECMQEYLAAVHEPSVQAAMLYVALAMLCQMEGDEKLYYHYLILSAINDIQMANRDAQSLVLILQSPYLDTSSKRASEYSMVCTENANHYKDYGRSFEVVAASAVIVKNYGLKLERQKQTMKWVIYLLALSILFICFMLWVIMKKKRQQTKLLKRMEDMTRSLQTMIEESKTMRHKLEISNEELKASKEKLEKEIKYRDSNFMDVYLLVSHYIKDVAAFKKAIFNLVTTGKVDKARKELVSTSATEKYLKGFYTQFDKAFLSSHSDFVERFNTLLKPEFHFVLPAPDTLTPELRIYALVSMGITDSISIADFLHYSPQTIYNYRLGVRRKACIPEKIFAETVAKMYL